MHTDICGPPGQHHVVLSQTLTLYILTELREHFGIVNILYLPYQMAIRLAKKKKKITAYSGHS